MKRMAGMRSVAVRALSRSVAVNASRLDYDARKCRREAPVTIPARAAPAAQRLRFHP